jgi:murein DD-endopeptidase MepM/ murein hydrolase activator NlpD
METDRIRRDELEPVRLPSTVAAPVETATAPRRLEGADYTPIDPDAPIVAPDTAGEAGGPRSFLDDGTLLKPTAVSTSVPDGKKLLRGYTAGPGEDVTDVAKKFGVSPSTVEWANRLKGPVLKAGEKLVIPPVDGVVVVTREGDTLDSLARRYRVDRDRIYTTNGLQDEVLVAGQTLVLPGATPAAPPDRKAVGGDGPVAPGGNDGKADPIVQVPRTYVGGPMTWPVVGGKNFVSQPFHGRHYGLDIAADYGARVTASAAGVVTYAGWKSNGGGYQVWIAHGSGLFTTYNHMSAVSVGVGQAVKKGQQVGRIGMSGRATGPHLHFEVWRGPIWDGGTRVNPLSFVKRP